MSFMKVDKEERILQRKQDMQERAQQREEDMNTIKDLINKVVTEKVIALVEPVTRRQDKLEEELEAIHKQVEQVKEQMNYIKLQNNKSEQREEVKSSRAKEVYVEYDEVVDQKEVREIVSNARKTVGLHCIPQGGVLEKMREGAENEDEAMFLLVKDFMQKQMKVNEEEFNELGIEKVFAPAANENWNTLYIKFTSQSSVSKLYSFARNLKNQMRLIPYIPKQFFNKYKELEGQAYQLRHSETKYKTRVRMGVSDLVLYKRKPQESSWKIHPSSSPTCSVQVEPTDSLKLNLRPNSGLSPISKNRE